ncbi:MAG: hypothetical protein IT430_20340 [Phycisphaerales bacterium]|nr:hypothetical protein [Phycisphaerales bacterium]
MSEARFTFRWPFPMATLAGGALVVAGFFLTGVSWWFFLLAAAGALGPGLLRELEILNDRDEFQRRADHRAGYFAFLVTGFVAFLMVAFIRSGGVFEHPERLPSFLLALLWFTWFFTSLLSYWGAPRTAARTLYAFGAVWLVFAILSNLGEEWTGWAALLLHPLLAVPFLALGWLATRTPRLAGWLLLLASAGFIVLFEVPRLQAGGLPSLVDDGAMLLFIGPLLASGISLLSEGRGESEDESDDDAAPSSGITPD